MLKPLRTPSRLLPVSRFRAAGLAFLLLLAGGCRRSAFPDVPDGYREFAYVANSGANTVSVLDLVYVRPDRTLAVGTNPTGMAVNPVRNEVYVVNTGSGSVSVIDAAANKVVATIGVHKLPYFISVEASGHRAFVANSGSNTVSVIDLDRRREISVAGTGEGPGMAVVSPDGRSLVVTNRVSGSVSVYEVAGYDPQASGPGVLRLRAAFAGCPGATDAVILPDSSKAFVACSTGHQVMSVALAAAAGSWPAKQDVHALEDHLLALLDVGQQPVHLALKPDGGEVFASNFGSSTMSEISTYTNEVSGTFPIGDKPVRSVVSADNSTLWVSNFGADSVSVYGIDDGHMMSSLRTGGGPDALTFSTDEHLLLAADSRSGDVAVIRTQGSTSASLFTMLPAGSKPSSMVVKSFTVSR